jgi:hypothetical protein
VTSVPVEAASEPATLPPAAPVIQAPPVVETPAPAPVESAPADTPQVESTPPVLPSDPAS